MEKERVFSVTGIIKMWDRYRVFKSSCPCMLYARANAKGGGMIVGCEASRFQGEENPTLYQLQSIV